VFLLVRHAWRVARKRNPLGCGGQAPMSVSVAANVGYALHNEAKAAFNNVDFQTFLRA
jgi:hypothetical protein